MYIYYDSKTGNVQRFVKKMERQRSDWHFIEVPETTDKFLENENNRKLIKSVSSSGNRNWGVFFAVAADKIQEKYGIPVLMKFELSGTNTEVENYINYLENNYK